MHRFIWCFAAVVSHPKIQWVWAQKRQEQNLFVDHRQGRWRILAPQHHQPHSWAQTLVRIFAHSLSLYLLYSKCIFIQSMRVYAPVVRHLFLYVQTIYLSDGTHTPGYHIICIRAYTLTALDVVLSSTSARRGALCSPRYMQNATI